MLGYAEIVIIKMTKELSNATIAVEIQHNVVATSITLKMTKV